MASVEIDMTAGRKAQLSKRSFKGNSIAWASGKLRSKSDAASKIVISVENLVKPEISNTTQYCHANRSLTCPRHRSKKPFLILYSCGSAADVTTSSGSLCSLLPPKMKLRA